MDASSQRSVGLKLSAMLRISELQLRNLRKGQLDFATVWRRTQDNCLSQLHVVREAIYVVAPRDRLGDHETVRPEDLAGLRLITTVDPLLIPGVSSGYLEYLPQIDYASGEVIDGILQVLAGGKHCAFVPLAHHPLKNAEFARDAGLVLRPLRPPVPILDTWLTWRTDRNRPDDLKTAIVAARKRYERPIVFA